MFAATEIDLYENIIKVSCTCDCRSKITALRYRTSRIESKVKDKVSYSIVLKLLYDIHDKVLCIEIKVLKNEISNLMITLFNDRRIENRIISIYIYSNLRLILPAQVCIPHKSEAVCAGWRIIESIHMVLVIRVVKDYSIDAEDSISPPHTSQPCRGSLMHICN